MDYSEFLETLNLETPPEMSKYLKSLWFAGKDNWNQAHEVAQHINDRNGCWIHAYLHREEGDNRNASYWYTKAGKTMPDSSLKEEWEMMVRFFLL